jgi:hypothetical protein
MVGALGVPSKQPGHAHDERAGGNNSEARKGDAMKDRTREIFGEPVYTYTRRQAIEDGVLVDLMQPETVALVREAGFKFPVAMTSGAFSATVAEIDKPLPEGQDMQGRLWDVLWMLRHGIKTSRTPDRARFVVMVWNGRHYDRVELWATCGPGDNGEPVITILLEGED